MMRLLTLALATWRLTAMLTQENGPADIFAELRQVAGVRYDPAGKPYALNFFGDVLACFWCCSVWAAAALWLAQRICPAVVDVLAASALAIGWKVRVMK